jgi:hypothetical protein
MSIIFANYHISVLIDCNIPLLKVLLLLNNHFLKIKQIFTKDDETQIWRH